MDQPAKPLPEEFITVPVIKGLPLLPYLPYVWEEVIIGGRGGVTYEFESDTFMLYLRPNNEDRKHCPFLLQINEVWVAMRGIRGRIN